MSAATTATIPRLMNAPFDSVRMNTPNASTGPKNAQAIVGAAPYLRVQCRITSTNRHAAGSTSAYSPPSELGDEYVAMMRPRSRSASARACSSGGRNR